MSGICGIVNLDCEPVDRQLLDDLTSLMVFRGPDAQDTWLEGPVGFGHTMLRTTFESDQERQPLSLDGRVWITADARVDGQAELVKKLGAQGRTGLGTANDVELILHAYHVWGEACVAHLIGDFAFAIWDGHRQHLFCARDHFGVKPFFFARVGHCLVFSNTLNCLRAHPAVSASLDESWIADFLLFEMSQDPGATAFTDIRRLPPGHCIVCSRDGLRVDRYWSLPTDLGVRYRQAGDYVEHFAHLLETAVVDRLRTDRVGIEMSGGLDSSALAATAKKALSRTGGPYQLCAYTVVYDRLIPDQERHFAGLVAQKLRIPIRYLAADEYPIFAHADQPAMQFPEPRHDPSATMTADSFAEVAEHCRVALAGWDGDALLTESPKPYLRHLFHERRFSRMLLALLGYAASERRLLPRGLWNRLLRRDAKDQSSLPYPDWLAPEFQHRLDLRDRWHQYNASLNARHPLHPYAYRSYSFLSACSNFFEYYDAGLTGLALEYRHPLMDLRLLDFCLSLPPWPWCVKKSILRSAMRGVLPEAVRTRPKTPLAGSPWIERLREGDASSLDGFVAGASLKRYVDARKIPRFRGASDLNDAWMNMRPRSLDIWLRGLDSADPQ